VKADDRYVISVIMEENVAWLVKAQGIPWHGMACHDRKISLTLLHGGEGRLSFISQRNENTTGLTRLLSIFSLHSLSTSRRANYIKPFTIQLFFAYCEFSLEKVCYHFFADDIPILIYFD